MLSQRSEMTLLTAKEHNLHTLCFPVGANNVQSKVFFLSQGIFCLVLICGAHTALQAESLQISAVATVQSFKLLAWSL